MEEGNIFVGGHTYIFYVTDRTFRSRTPIPETSDDDGLNNIEIQVEADIEDKGNLLNILII